MHNNLNVQCYVIPIHTSRNISIKNFVLRTYNNIVYHLMYRASDTAARETFIKKINNLIKKFYYYILFFFTESFVTGYAKFTK